MGITRKLIGQLKQFVFNSQCCYAHDWYNGKFTGPEWWYIALCAWWNIRWACWYRFFPPTALIEDDFDAYLEHNGGNE